MFFHTFHNTKILLDTVSIHIVWIEKRDTNICENRWEGVDFWREAVLHWMDLETHINNKIYQNLKPKIPVPIKYPKIQNWDLKMHK
jgi:hypothetical protein